VTTSRYFTIMFAAACAAVLIGCELFQVDPATGVTPVVPIAKEAIKKAVENPTIFGITEAISTAVVTGLVGWLAIRRRNAKKAAASK